ncbi:MAG: phosphatidylinositol-binding protein scs2 [Watsoniomyces obsoletus]|nr:MAG: phosphatidylinositol-binding protein scs2 [Watsoniomyces obsoletus]
MAVELSPSELAFRRPFTQQVTQTLHLRNIGPDPVAFKVKTTAPKQYCVRPNSGRVESGETVDVSVILQAMKEDPPPDAKCRDKFLVQSIAVTADKETVNLQTLWHHMEVTARESIHEKKIRVTYIAADAPANAHLTPMREGINGTRDMTPLSHDPPPYETPAGHSDTPTRGADNKHLSEAKTDEGSDFSPSSSGGGVNGVTDHHDNHNNDNKGTITMSTLTSLPSTIVKALPSSPEELKSQLEEAQATIVRLTKQVENEVLTQRKTKAVVGDMRQRITEGTNAVGSKVQQAGGNTVSAGVPVPIVAGLCLLSFLLAYLLF